MSGAAIDTLAALVGRGLERLEEAIPDSVATPHSDSERHPRRAVQLLGTRLYEPLLIEADRTNAPHELTTQET